MAGDNSSFKALVAPLKDLGFIPSRHMMVHNLLYLHSQRIQHPLLTFMGTGCMWCITYI